MTPCDTKNCVRVLGHSGCHTAAPSARTLDWDHDQSVQRNTAKTLEFLDFESPSWADLND